MSGAESDDLARAAELLNEADAYGDATRRVAQAIATARADGYARGVEDAARRVATLCDRISTTESERQVLEIAAAGVRQVLGGK